MTALLDLRKRIPVCVHSLKRKSRQIAQITRRHVGHTKTLVFAILFHSGAYVPRTSSLISKRQLGKLLVTFKFSLHTEKRAVFSASDS